MKELAIQNIPTPTQIEPFRIKQLISGLERGVNDESFLGYLDFLSTQIPVDKAYFLHVTPRLEMISGLFKQGEGISMVPESFIKERIVNEMGAEISRYLPSRKINDIHYDVRQGSPLEELLADAKELEASHIAIGQKSGTNSHGILAKSLVRKVTMDALIVPDRAHHSLRKILVPIDFSSYSAKALQTAIALNKQLEEPAEIVCLNVYEMPDFASFKISRTEEQLHKMVLKDRKEAFEAFLKMAVPEDSQPIPQVLIEKENLGIGQYIWRYAAEHAVDFIVMGAKGHSKVELLLLGSATERLLTVNDRIPTLVVR